MLCARQSFCSQKFLVDSLVSCGKVVEGEVLFSGGLGSIGSSFGGLGSSFDNLLDGVVMLVHLRLDDVFVDVLGATSLGEHQAGEESKFQPLEVGNNVEEEASEGLNEGESSVDHPVSQPVLIIVAILSLDSADGEDCGVAYGDEEGKHLPSVNDEHNECNDTGGSSDEEARVDSNLSSEVLNLGDLVAIGVENSGRLSHSLLDLVRHVISSLISSIIGLGFTHFGMFSVERIIKIIPRVLTFGK
jgi:hypothetical protein